MSTITNKFEAAILASDDGFWDWDLTTNAVYFSDRYYTMLGYAEQEFPGSFAAFEGLLHPEDAPMIKAAVGEHLSGKTANFSVEFRAHCKDGSYLWIQGRGKIIERDKDGKPLRMVGLHTDISTRKATEEAVEKARALLESVLDSAHKTLIFSVDRDFRYTCINKANREAVKGLYGKEIKVGDLALEVIADPAEREKLQKIGERVFAGEHVRMDEAWGEESRTRTYFHNNFQPILDAKGNVVGMTAFLQDVTDRKRYESDLEEKLLTIEAQRAAIAQMSTPIMQVWEGVLCLPVIGMVDTARSAEMTDKLLEAVVRNRAYGVIVDLTGIDIVDTKTADHFIKMAKAVRLLGSTPVITGISPAIAQTLTSIGVDMSGIRTMRNLHDGLRIFLAASVDRPAAPSPNGQKAEP